MSTAPQGRVKELMDEEVTRPRSDSTGSRTRSWSGTDFAPDTGRPRTFSTERRERRLVILAVDDSAASYQAFDWFCEVVHDSTTYLLLLHVPELRDVNLSGDVGFSPSLWEESVQREKDNITQLKADFEKKMLDRQVTGKWLTLNTSRKPGEALVKAAHEYQAKFIVVGCRGQSAIKRTLMGSVSDYIVHHAKIPVLVVRQKKK